MTADETLLSDAERWGREFDQPTPDTLTAAEAVLTAHEWTVHDACLCGWQQTAGRTHPGHVVQELAAAGLLGALAELARCTCIPCTDLQYGVTGVAHCAGCCMGTGIEEYDPACPDGEHREMAERQFGRPASAPAPRPAVRTGSFAGTGGPRHLTDEEAG